MKTFDKNGKSILYQVIYKKNKYTYFRIKDGFLKITAPISMKEQQISKYLSVHFDAIYEKIHESKMKLPENEISLWGHHYEMVCSKGTFAYQIKDGYIHVSSFEPFDYQHIKKRIYFNEIKRKVEAIHPSIESIIRTHQLAKRCIKFKYLKSKYGSYHKKNDEITLNTFLATLPDVYLSYVMLHEYAHVIVFNHSKSFYDVLTQWMPNHKTYQKRLKNIAIY